MSANQVAPETLEEYVKKGIEKWQKGDLFITAGVGEKDMILKSGENLPPEDDKQHPYNKFLGVVAESLAGDYMLPSVKRLVKQLQSKSKQWQALIVPICEEIAARTPSPKKASTEKKSGAKVKKEEPLDEKTLVPESFDRQLAAEGGAPANKSSSERNLEQKKKAFEEARDEILADVPEDLKERFGQIFFSKWAKQVLPVLVLNPYSVPPGSVRDLWLKMYDTCKEKHRLPHMTNLTYWYGASSDPQNAYSFIATSALIPYEAGVKKGHDKLPVAVQKKLDEGKPVPANCKMLVEGLEEMREDLVKDPKDRRGWMASDFKEAYTIPTDDENEEASDERPIATKKAKAAKGKKESKAKEPTSGGGKKRKAKEEEPREVDGSDEGLAEAATKKSKKGKNMKKVTKKGKKEPPASSEMASFFSLGKQPKSGKTPKLQEEPPLDAAAPAAGDQVLEGSVRVKTKLELEEEIKYALGESESEGSKDDDDFDDEDFGGGAADKADHDLSGDLVESTLKKSKGRRPSKIQKEKEPPKKKAKKVKHKIEKGIEKVKKVPSEKARRMAEQKKYNDSDKVVRPVLKKWQKAMDSNDEKGIIEVFKEMQPLVEKVHWALMPDIMKKYVKPSKSILTQKDVYKKLYESLKAHYAEVQKEAIPGWQPEVVRSNEEEKRESAHSTVKQEPAPAKDAVAGKDALTPTKDESQKTLLGTPIKRIGSLEKVVEKPQSEPAPQKDVKVERKKFSLGNLMRPTSEAAKGAVKSSSTSKSAPTQVLQKQQAIPDWLTGASPVEAPKDDPRALGLEFLQQATPSIPMSKGVDHGAIALALEAAIFKSVKSDHQSKWVQKYWEKIDSIGVAISGDKEVGTIASMIAQGKFESADQVVGLSDDAIMNSFLGKPVILP